MIGLAEGISDAALVERARQADQVAFAALYQRHARYLAGVVYRLMGDDQELEDIVQETFLLASDALARLVQPDRVRPWLVTIAVRRAQHHLARRRRRWFLLSRLAELVPTVSDPADRGDVDELYRALDRSAAWRALRCSHVSSACRAPFVTLHRWSGHLRLLARLSLGRLRTGPAWERRMSSRRRRSPPTSIAPSVMVVSPTAANSGARSAPAPQTAGPGVLDPERRRLMR